MICQKQHREKFVVLSCVNEKVKQNNDGNGELKNIRLSFLFIFPNHVDDRDNANQKTKGGNPIAPSRAHRNHYYFIPHSYYFIYFWHCSYCDRREVREWKARFKGEDFV